MSVKTIQDAIGTVVAGVMEVRASYTYPITDPGRALPALEVRYDGFESGPGEDNIRWAFEFTLFLPAEGKRLEAAWGDLITVAEKVLLAFYADPTLSGACWRSVLESGEPVIHTPATGSALWIGHTFRLVADEHITW